MSDDIVVVAVGPVEPEILVYLCRAISEALHAPCRVGPGKSLPDDAFNTRRQQYSADAIVNGLPRGGADRVLGVAERDLYVAELNFVFGLADPPARRAVIALPRLHEGAYRRPENPLLFLQRAAKEAMHELGHTYGLKHCSDRHCVMAFSNSLRDTDFKGREFCPNCQKAMRGRDVRRDA